MVKHGILGLIDWPESQAYCVLGAKFGVESDPGLVSEEGDQQWLFTEIIILEVYYADCHS